MDRKTRSSIEVARYMWADLLPPCLESVGQLLSAAEMSAARLVCRSWSRSISLQQISINLANKQQPVVRGLARPGNCAQGARRCIITVPWAGKVHSSVVQQLAAVLPGMPNLRSLTVRTAAANSGSASMTVPGNQLAAGILQPLAAALQHRLQSLTLSLHDWPEQQQLAAALAALPQLRTLRLSRCRLSVLCQLPPLPHLQHLSVAGLISEPVPASYSYRRRPMLPPLPALQTLALRSMPLDLRLQELEDIDALQARPPCCGARGSRSLAGAWQQLQQGQQRAVRPGQLSQWVASSVALQCPALQELTSDMELGPALLSLTQLTKLHGLHPSWLEAAATQLAAAQAADALSRGSGVAAAPAVLQQLRRLRHVGIGVDTARDCELLAACLPRGGLTSLAVWSSSSCGLRQAAAMADSCSDLWLPAPPTCWAAGGPQPQQAPDTTVAVGAGRSIRVLVSGLGCSLRSLTVDGGWQLGSADIQALVKVCSQLRQFDVCGSSVL